MTPAVFFAFITVVTGLTAFCFFFYRRRQRRKRERQHVVQRLRIAFYNTPISACITRLHDGYIVDINTAFADLLERERAELLGKNTLEIQLWQTPSRRQQFVAQIEKKGRATDFPLDIANRPGGYYLINTIAPFFMEEEAYIVSYLIDITLEKKSEAQLDSDVIRFKKLYESMLDGYTRLDKDGFFQECNRAFCEALGYTEEELRNMTPRNITPTYLHERDARIEEQVKRQGFCELYEKEQIRKDGSVFPIELQLYASYDNNNECDGMWGIVRDISKRKRDQADIDFLAHHDPLTGLPNRNLLLDRLEHALERARREGNHLAVLFIDLDRFKNISSTLGHHAGDALLQTVARNMNLLLRGSDTLACMSGDEFVVLLEENINPHNVSVVAEKLTDLFMRPFLLKTQEIYITASIGISLFPSDSEDAETMLKHANLAMFKAKQDGRNTYRFYESENTTATDAFEHLALENALRSAIKHNELLLYYQPQIEISTKKLIGVEALVRWRHPEQGMMPPGRFIPIAEDSGIINEIGAWVLRTACCQMGIWRRQGFDVPRMAINLSMQQLERANLVETVRQELENAGLEANLLELEVTESILMRQIGQALKILNDLERLGVYLAIDDFGTGYSSLAYLSRLPMRRLKIDYSFTRDIGKNNSSEIITRTIIALGNSLGLEVIAEGVERQEQEDFLRREGCLLTQGFLYDQPIPPDALMSKYCPRPVNPVATSAKTK
ncbi:MAG: EAL domain-containing protein [Zoogloeaceae bacterium]|jgi:diguanylate cyclase (GGDEF)-like protein/PAS domain S-box-containing protein|nr:EAL domain-containing protein [Zoogloeaceae bacterium]